MATRPVKMSVYVESVLSAEAKQEAKLSLG